MNSLRFLQTLASASSLGDAVAQLGSPGFPANQALVMTSEAYTAAVSLWGRTLNRVFEGRSIDSICWAFGASLERQVRPEKIQSLCNALCKWISTCANDVIYLHTESFASDTGAAVWGAVQGAVTEMIYQYVHEEGFTSMRFLGSPELVAGLPCPTGCGSHLRHAHGGCCDAICRCGVIVEEKKTRHTLATTSSNVRSGALDSATPEALANTWFFIHARDQSVKLAPGQWERRPVLCRGCNVLVATHNAPGEKCGLMCEECCSVDWVQARQVDTFLHFDYQVATPIVGMQELAIRMGREDVDSAAFVLLSCQRVCIDLWKERDPGPLSAPQRRWREIHPTNWKRKLKEWWPKQDDVW